MGSFEKRKVEGLSCCDPPVGVEDNHSGYQIYQLLRRVWVVPENSVLETISIHFHLCYLLVLYHHRLQILQCGRTKASYYLCEHSVGVTPFKQSPVHQQLGYHTAQGPDINLSTVVYRSKQKFRCPVVPRTNV